MLTIAAEAPTGSPGQTIALTGEIAASGQPDPDSTPNNGVFGEDDLDAVSIEIQAAASGGSELAVAPSETQGQTAGPPDLSAAITVDVASATGAVLEAPDHRLTIRVPAGAVSENVRVSFKALDKPVYGVPGKRMVNMFELNAEAVDRGGAPVTVFDEDVEIEFAVPALGMNGLNLSSLGLYYRDESTGEWIEVPSKFVVDPLPRFIAKIRHFSIFGYQAGPNISGPGAVAGFQNDLHSGAAMISLPIEVPPGPGGFAPKISLSYNSNSPNEMKDPADLGSWVGIGWRLNLGGVHGPSSKGTIGVDNGPLNKSLEINGTSYKLVPADPDTPSNNNPSNVPYRTEPESFSKITRVNMTEWTIRDKQGTYFRFGATASAIQYYGEATLDPCQIWLTYYYRSDLEYVEDLHGNVVDIAYTQNKTNECYEWPWGSEQFISDVTSAYPEDIYYGKNLNDASITHRFNVHFNSSIDNPGGNGGTRTDNPYGNTRPRVRENAYLDSIEVRVDNNDDGDYTDSGELVRRYDFTWLCTKSRC